MIQFSSLAVEGLIAAEGHLEGSDAGERDVGFAGLEVVAVDREAGGPAPSTAASAPGTSRARRIPALPTCRAV